MTKRFSEGVNPTDMDSAGTDQVVANAGKPFDAEKLSRLNDLRKGYVAKLGKATESESRRAPWRTGKGSSRRSSTLPAG